MSIETKFRTRRPGSSQSRRALRRRGDDRARACPAPDQLWETEETEAAATLEEAVLTTFAALTAGHPVECPVCSGPLTLADGCRRCGSHLT